MNATKKLVYIALSTALIAVLTMFPHIPVAKGYIHLGDGMIIASAFIIGIYAVPAAALGSALADVITGYAIYAPATFVIKAAMALLAFAIIKKREDLFGMAAGSLACEAAMAAGYFLCDLGLFGLSVALTSLPFSLIQAAGGIAVGVALCAVTKKFGLKEKIWSSLGGR